MKNQDRLSTRARYILTAQSPTLISGCLALMIFTSRLSLSVKSIALVTSLALILLTVPFKNLIKTFLQHPVARAAAFFYICLILGSFYSAAPLPEQWHTLKLYLPLLWIGVFIAFFQYSTAVGIKKWFTVDRIKIYSSVFVYGVVLVSILGCLNALHVFDIAGLIHSELSDPPEYPFGTFSFSLSFAAYLSLKKFHYAFTRTLRYRYVACFLFLSFFILFVNHERTAYVLYLFLLLVYACQHFNLKRFFSILLALTLCVSAAYHFSATFHHRTLSAIHEVEMYYRDNNPLSSTGLRLFFIKTSFHIWKERPIFGFGTGSFKEVYRATGGYNAYGRISTPEETLDQPHNDYMYILVQLGLFGLIPFLYLMLQQYLFAFQLPIFEKQCAIAFILCFMLGATDATLLFYGTSATDYCFFSALLYSGIFSKNRFKNF